MDIVISCVILVLYSSLNLYLLLIVQVQYLLLFFYLRSMSVDVGREGINQADKERDNRVQCRKGLSEHPDVIRTILSPY